MEVDWRHGAEHMWSNHKVTVAEASQALADVGAVWLDPDPKSQSGRSIRVIGYCRDRSEILTVILVREPDRDQLWGANGWPANSQDRALYRKAGDNL